MSQTARPLHCVCILRSLIKISNLASSFVSHSNGYKSKLEKLKAEAELLAVFHAELSKKSTPWEVVAHADSLHLTYHLLSKKVRPDLWQNLKLAPSSQ